MRFLAWAGLMLMMGAVLGAVAVGAPGPARRGVPALPTDPDRIHRPGVYALATLPTYYCRRAAGPIQIDGMLEDEGWRDAAHTSAFLNWNARGLPQFLTSARLAWDARGLYVAFLCKDEDISSPYQKRDEPLSREDAAGVVVGIHGYPEHYFAFEVSPANVLSDARVYNPGPSEKLEADRAWNARRIQTAVRVDGTLNRRGDRDQSWTVEMAIPFSDLGLRRAPEAGELWRINLYRIDRSPEPSYAAWSPPLGAAGDVHKPAQFGYLGFTQ